MWVDLTTHLFYFTVAEPRSVVGTEEVRSKQGCSLLKGLRRRWGVNIQAQFRDGSSCRPQPGRVRGAQAGMRSVPWLLGEVGPNRDKNPSDLKWDWALWHDSVGCNDLGLKDLK